MLPIQESSGKVMSVSAAAVFMEEKRKSGARVSMVSGSFDVFHAGHVHFLEEARAQGDLLIVLLNSDASVRSYKGPMRPVVPQEERSILLAALTAVDGVVLFDESTPLTVLETLHPDVYCNGSDYGPECIERDIVMAHGGVVHIIERGAGSSTNLINRILERYSDSSN